MSDLHERIIESPALYTATSNGLRRTVVSYRGHKMYPGTARRLVQLRPSVEQMNAKGVTLRKAAMKLGYTRNTFRKFLRIWGIRWKTVESHTRPELDKTGWREAILDGAAKGLTQQQIGERLDTDLVNIHRYCKRNGIDWKAVSTRYEKADR